MALVDYFLKLDGIEGESTDHKHKGELAIQSWSIGATQGGAVDRSALGGAGAGKVHLNDFSVTTHVDKSTPKLFLACATGEHIKKAVLTCRKAGKDQQEFLKVTMSDVLVTSYNLVGHAEGQHIPQIEFTLNYGAIEKEYKEQKQDGSLGAAVKVGWDVKANKKV
jgi:type VI secretion system secreted protein Hcp